MKRLNEMQRNLVQENLHLVSIILNKYIQPNNSIRELERDDLFQAGAMALCVAAMNFNSDKGVMFQTYASRVIKNEIYSRCRYAHVRYPKTYSIEKNQCQCNNIEEMENRQYYERILRDANKNFKGIALKGVQVIEMQIKGISNEKIAKIYDVSQNNIHAWASRARKKIRKEMIIKGE